MGLLYKFPIHWNRCRLRYFLHAIALRTNIPIREAPSN